MDEQVQAQEEMRGERGDLRDRLTEILSVLSEKGKENALYPFSCTSGSFVSVGRPTERSSFFCHARLLDRAFAHCVALYKKQLRSSMQEEDLERTN